MNKNKEIEEHDVVKATTDIVLFGYKLVSKDDEGTVVHIYPNNEDYEVEFPKIGGTLTVNKSEIQIKN